jgi:predicted AAA+ superfamily ATPase
MSGIQTSASLVAVTAVNRLALDLLRGVDEQRDLLMTNTTAFASRLPANNALLWGARGTGKSSLVKSVHGRYLKKRSGLRPCRNSPRRYCRFTAVDELFGDD